MAVHALLFVLAVQDFYLGVGHVLVAVGRISDEMVGITVPHGPTRAHADFLETVHETDSLLVADRAAVTHADDCTRIGRPVSLTHGQGQDASDGERGEYGARHAYGDDARHRATTLSL
jgi:hypothetical protein